MRHYYTVVKQKDSRTVFPEFKSCLHQLENLGQVSCSISLCLSFLKLLLFSHSVMSNSLWPPGLQLARPPCPSPSPGACSSSCYLSRMIMIQIANTAYVCVQLCPTFFELTDSSLPGSSVHGIFQARIPEWVAISFSMGSSWSRDQTHVFCISCIGRWILYQLSYLGSPSMEKQAIQNRWVNIWMYLLGKRWN